MAVGTPEEQDAARAILYGKAQQALTTNANALALPDPTAGNNTFLALSSPTNAQTLAQVRALTNQMNAMYAASVASIRQRNALIRLALSLLDSTDNT